MKLTTSLSLAVGLLAGFIQSAAAAPALQLTSSIYDFGNTSVNAGPTTLAITLSNPGDQPLVFDGPGIELTGDSAYSIVDMPTTTTAIEPGSSRTLIVAFDPTQEGYVEGMLGFSTNEGASPFRQMRLKGFGVWAEIQASVGSLNFGSKVITDPEAHVLSLDIENWGTESLQFTGSGFTIAGPNPSQYSFIDTPSTAPIPVGQTVRRVKIGFKPSSTGSKTAWLQITSNDPQQPTLIIGLLGTGVSPRPVAFTGPFDGKGPGTSTIGAGGHYSSLKAACDAISGNSLTGGDWNFVILNDLTETQNSTLYAGPTGGYKFVFRPATGTSSTISFTNPTLNTGSFPGHLIIGARYNTPTAKWEYKPTSRVVIDGSNGSSPSSQNLTFRNPEQAGGTTSLIHVAGDCDYITIRNCHFYHTPGFYTSIQGNTGPVEFIGEPTPPESAVPPNFTRTIIASADYATVENCNFLIKEVNPIDSAVIASNFRYQSISNFQVDPATVGIRFTSNTMSTRSTGIYVRGCDDLEIRNNRVEMIETPNVNRLRLGIGLSPDSAAVASSIVDSNRIRFEATTPTQGSAAGIAFQSRNSSCTFEITNNMISGLTGASTFQAALSRTAIANNTDRYTTALIAHNSISMNHMEGTTTSLGRLAAMEFSFVNQIFGGFASVRNNVIRVTGEDAVVYRILDGTGVLDARDNILYTGAQSHVGYLVSGRSGTLYSSLQDWQTSRGVDMDSVTLDPLVPASPGLGSWIGPADSYNPDMHFTSYPGPHYLSAPVAGVTRDIDGDARDPQPTAGADEKTQFPSRVAAWQLY